MKQNKSSFPLVLIFLTILLFTFFVISTDAKRHTHLKRGRSHHKHPRRGTCTSNGKDIEDGSDDNSNAPGIASPSCDPSPAQPNVFNVMSFGAKGDGVSDDSKALLGAWKAACKVPSANVEIPQGFKFLIKPITLQGPCMPFLTLQVDGRVVALPKVGSWAKSSLFQWINFKWVSNFTIKGSGAFDGQGAEWWSLSLPQIYFIQRRSSKHIPDMKPTVLRFYSSYNVTVRDITIMNSPQCHLKFDDSGGVKVTNITITSPESSPNTDGIHLQNTRDVEIEHSNIGCGDDCVSIQTGCSNVHVHHINCGPGHGISLGGLGKDNSVACVSNIIVESLSLQNTLYGVRIKTWQGGLGLVKNVSFSNIQVNDVKVPLMIDQYYCDKHICKNQSEAVAISGVKFDQIVGTYVSQPLHLACSHDIPCTGVDLTDIRLTPSPGLGGSRNEALCYNSYGKSVGPLLPLIIDGCLRSEDGAVRRTARSHDMVCR